MEKNKRDEEKARKMMDKETQKKMLQSVCTTTTFYLLDFDVLSCLAVNLNLIVLLVLFRCSSSINI